MVVRRRQISRSQDKPENAVTNGSLQAEALLINGFPRVEHTTAVPISIVSNSRLLSEGLLALLSPYLNLQLVGTYSGECPAISPLPNPPGHVVLMDSSMGPMVAIAWTRYWRRLIPPSSVLILELVDDNALILACIEAGASGYTLQGASAVEVATAIEDIRCGVAHCPPEVIAQLYARVAALRTAVTQLSVSPLTARESEILRFVARGYANLEISTQLVIELRTVKQHVHHILEKLNVPSRGAAVCFAIEHGWLAEDRALLIES